MMKKLTIKQKMALEAIDYFINEKGYSPSYREIAELLGFKSTNSAYNLVLTLESKGYIITDIGKSRTIRIVNGEGYKYEKD